MRLIKLAAGATFLVAAILWSILVWRKPGSSSIDMMPSAGGQRADSLRDSRSVQESGTPDSEIDLAQAPRSLAVFVLSVDEKSAQASPDELVATARRKVLSDDDILIRGGVLPAAPKTASAGDVASGPRSIKSGDWQEAANLLVNALRAGDRFEVDHGQLMDFLRGKDLLGWPEGTRNWIGDELMTALRQDMPQSAFEDLKSIEADSSAPAAMRDYSVQHISHLVTSGTIGQEGADFIWQTLGKNDPQTLSTALISLHRLSEQVPELVAAEKVKKAAERLRESPDERTRMTAQSILKK